MAGDMRNAGERLIAAHEDIVGTFCVNRAGVAQHCLAMIAPIAWAAISSRFARTG